MIVHIALVASKINYSSVIHHSKTRLHSLGSYVLIQLFPLSFPCAMNHSLMWRIYLFSPSLSNEPVLHVINDFFVSITIPLLFLHLTNDLGIIFLPLIAFPLPLFLSNVCSYLILPFPCSLLLTSFLPLSACPPVSLFVFLLVSSPSVAASRLFLPIDLAEPELCCCICVHLIM